MIRRITLALLLMGSAASASELLDAAASRREACRIYDALLLDCTQQGICVPPSYLDRLRRQCTSIDARRR